MGKTLKEKELEKKEQELIILTIFAIGLLESTKPNRNAKDYIRAGLLGFGFLYSVALILYSILSSFSRQLPNSTPGHLNKDELKKLYENVPLVKPKPLIRQPLACFDPNKPGSEVDWARMKMKVPYEGLVQIDQVYTDAYATCKSNDLYQPLNCERVIEDNICQKIQQEYCDLDKLNNLITSVVGIDAKLLTMSFGLAVANLSLLLKSERDRMLLDKSLMSEDGLKELKRIGGILQIEINPKAHMNDLIDVFKAKLDLLRSEMRETKNPSRLFKTPVVENITEIELRPII